MKTAPINPEASNHTIISTRTTYSIQTISFKTKKVLAQKVVESMTVLDEETLSMHRIASNSSIRTWLNFYRIRFDYLAIINLKEMPNPIQ